MASSYSQLTLITALLLTVAGYVVCVTLYRLFLHPLAKFPGPKLAGLTFGYHFYYDVILQGQFTFHIRDLHKRFGPIVRITPDEIHIDDPEFFNELFTKQGRLDRDPRTVVVLGADTAVFATANSEHHRLRRAPLAPLFSRKNAIRFEPIIKDKVAELITAIRRFQTNGEILAINKAYMNLAEDMIYQYCFGKNNDRLSTPGFGNGLDEAFRAVVQGGYLTIFFPWIPKIMSYLPSILTKISPSHRTLLNMRRDIMGMVEHAQSDPEKEYASAHNDYASVIRELQNSSLPAHEKTLDRITDETSNLLSAGVSTSGWTATVASYHITLQPHVFATLREELISNFPDLTTIPDYIQLEKLKYLSGCVKEGLRMSLGKSWRSARIPRQGPIQYKDWIIPQNSVVSMTKHDILFDERVFVSPNRFIPERWIDHSKYNAGVNPYDYHIAFGKGSRSCLGRELAYVEIYHMLAAVFRNFELELYETDESDVVIAHDFVIPLTKLDSQGVRVRVKA